MAEDHPGREEREMRCDKCGAAIHYSIESASSSEPETLRCPSCGTGVKAAGSDPKLLEFGPGQGQHGA